MVGNRGSRRKEDARHSDSSDDDDDDEDQEPEGPPQKFVLAGDDTGSGIEYNILDPESWQKLEHYCKKWGIKQAHLESIYSRFARTIIRTEHLDFTLKPQYHASLDFLADEFMTTAGEFAAQIFIQTWFLRRKRGLAPPQDRRCVDFTRLVIMCSDLARLGDYELLTNLWACVLHRFSGILPTGTVDLDTRVNVEMVREVITMLHKTLDKKLDLLIDMLLEESEEVEIQGGIARTRGLSSTSSGGGGGTTRTEEEGQRKVVHKSNGEEAEGAPVQAQRRRYLTLRSILRFSFQHPPLMFPVVQFQRVLRCKIIGSRYWLRRRRPAFERGLDMRSSLGLPNAYCDVFDRIESRGAAWLVATGHVLLHAFDPPARGDAAAAASDSSSSSKLCNDGMGVGGRRATSGEGRDGDRGDDGRDDEERREEQYRRLLDNCLEPPWYEKKIEKTAATTTAIEAVGGKAMPSLTATLTRLTKSSTSATSSLPSDTRSAKNKSIGRASSPAVTVPQPGSPGGNLQAQPRPSPIPSSPQTMTPLSLPSSAGTGPRRRSQSPGRRSHRQGGNRTGTRSPAANTRLPATTAVGLGGKTCAVCLRRSSPAAMCPKCGRRAAKALKDREGSRKARVILVPYGGHFGVGEADALQREGDSIKRWVRLLDDETGADFYHNVHYGSSVWKSGIELPKPAPVVKAARRQRKVGDAGGGVVAVVGSPNSAASVPRGTTPPAPGSPAARALPMARAATSPRAMGMAASGGIVHRTALVRRTMTAFSAASMAALRAAAGGTANGGDSNDGEDDDRKSKNYDDDDSNSNKGTSSPRPIIKPAIKKAAAVSSPASSPPPPQKNASASPTAAAASPGRNRVVVRDAGDAEPEVVLDAHRRIYPPFRLVSWEEVEAAAVAAELAGMKGVSPRPGTGMSGRKSYSQRTSRDSAGRGRRPRLTTAVTKGGG
ncbi:unnamed protein product [Ectocarpus sp. 12 AP-2014]